MLTLFNILSNITINIIQLNDKMVLFFLFFYSYIKCFTHMIHKTLTHVNELLLPIQ